MLLIQNLKPLKSWWSNVPLYLLLHLYDVLCVSHTAAPTSDDLRQLCLSVSGTNGALYVRPFIFGSGPRLELPKSEYGRVWEACTFAEAWPGPFPGVHLRGLRQPSSALATTLQRYLGEQLHERLAATTRTRREQCKHPAQLPKQRESNKSVWNGMARWSLRASHASDSLQALAGRPWMGL